MRKIFEKAEAVWHLNNKYGGENCPFDLMQDGQVDFIELTGEEAALSEKSSGDGHAAVFRNGCLRLNMYQAVRYRPAEGRVSLYVRVKLDEKQQGCFFYSDFLCLSVYKSRLIAAHVGVRTKNGAAFREMPLCYEKGSGWRDMIVTIGDNVLSFYVNGHLRGRFEIAEDLCSPFSDDMIIGAFRCCKPDTYSDAVPFARFDNLMMDTVAIWHKTLAKEEIRELSAGEFYDKYEKNDVTEAIRLQNEYFDASVREDIGGCRRIWNEITEITSKDPQRPKWHLTQPFGYIFDPCGAFYHNGRYNVYSYRNIEYLLNYSSLDHYASDDLVNWYGMPISPFADSESDVYCIYLMNHFKDDKGNIRALYTGQGFSGKRGILAREDEDMISFGDKHAVLKKYHHDGHVFRHGDRWYTITSKLCRNTREGDRGDPVMMWSSEDLEDWKEEGEIFYQKKAPWNPEGFMEFPYLLNFGEKDVLILGGHPVKYWVGHFDWDRKIFETKQSEGILLDNTNPFNCFNPLCVDDKGENGSERRIIMAMYPDIGRTDGEIQWTCCHIMPKKLSLENDHLRQDVLPEFEKLRGESDTVKNIRIEGGSETHNKIQGDSLEIRGIFVAPEKGSCGIKIIGTEDNNDIVNVSYCKENDTFTVSGNVRHGGTFPAYHEKSERKGQPVEIRVFTDKTLVEIFVNGQCATTSFTGEDNLNRRTEIFGDGVCKCVEYTVWKLK